MVLILEWTYLAVIYRLGSFTPCCDSRLGDKSLDLVSEHPDEHHIHVYSLHGVPGQSNHHKVVREQVPHSAADIVLAQSVGDL